MPGEGKPLPLTLAARSRWESSLQRGKEWAGLAAEGKEGEEIMEAIPWETLSKKDLLTCLMADIRGSGSMYWIDCLGIGEGCLSRAAAGEATEPPCLGRCTGLGAERRALGGLGGKQRPVT